MPFYHTPFYVIPFFFLTWESIAYIGFCPELPWNSHCCHSLSTIYFEVLRKDGHKALTVGEPYLLCWFSKYLLSCAWAPPLPPECFFPEMFSLLLFFSFCLSSSSPVLSSLFPLVFLHWSFQKMLCPHWCQYKHFWHWRSSIFPGVLGFIIFNSLGSHRCYNTVSFAIQRRDGGALGLYGRGVVCAEPQLHQALYGARHIVHNDVVSSCFKASCGPSLHRVHCFWCFFLNVP